MRTHALNLYTFAAPSALLATVTSCNFNLPMRHIRTLIIPALALAALIHPCEVGAVTVTYDPINTTVVNIIGVTGYQTYGNEMAGMTVTADFADGSSDTEIWKATSSTGGAVVGQGWQLAENGDTYTSNWIMTITDRTLQISSLTLTGFVASDVVTDGTAFDRTQPDPGTANSSNGHDLSVSSATGAWNAIDVAYRDPLRSLSSGQSVQYDEYRQIELTFGSLANGTTFVPTPFVFGNSLSFVQDTDTVGMPEPSSFILAAMGLLCIAAIRSRTGFRADRVLKSQ
jgi:hypothetical protein